MFNEVQACNICMRMEPISDKFCDIRNRVWQGDAEGGEFVHYDVAAQESQTVLDAVTWIQQNAAPALTYRFACRVAHLVIVFLIVIQEESYF